MSAHWTYTDRAGWMQHQQSWALVDVYANWTGKPGASEGTPEVIQLLLDKKLNEALAMIADNPRCALAFAVYPSPVAGNNLIHVLSQRSPKEFGARKYEDCWSCCVLETKTFAMYVRTNPKLRWAGKANFGDILRIKAN